MEVLYHILRNTQLESLVASLAPHLHSMLRTFCALKWRRTHEPLSADLADYTDRDKIGEDCILMFLKVIKSIIKQSGKSGKYPRAAS